MTNVRVDVTAETKDFVAGVENAEDALDTLVDTMDDAEKESLRSANKMEKSLKDVAEAAKDTSQSTKPIGKGFKDASKDASEGLQEIKDESRSTAKEAAASFDGSATSIVDAFQEVAANAFAGFGTAGLVAGAAVAAGIGIATAEFTKSEEAAQAAREKVKEFGLAIIDSGTAVAGLEFIDSNLRDIITNSDDATKKFEDIEKLLKKYPDLSTDVGTLAMAYAGNTDAIEESTKALDEEIDRLQEGIDLNSDAGRAIQVKVDALESEKQALEDVAESTANAQKVAETYAEAGADANAVHLSSIQQINGAYDEAVTSVDAFYNAETGILDVTGYAASIEARKQLLTEYQNNLAASGLTPEQIAALNEMGVEQANALLEGLQDPNVAQSTKDTITQGLSESAGAASGVAKDKMKDTFSKEAIEQKVVPVPYTKDYYAKLDEITKTRSMDIKLRFVNEKGVAYD